MLSSTPTNVAQVERAADNLLKELNVPDEDLARAFRVNHQCRTPEMPQVLVDAYANAGSVWRGTTAISDYNADGTVQRKAMSLRGQYDFVTEECVEGWGDRFDPPPEFVNLYECSHHGLLERPESYGKVLDGFWRDQETGTSLWTFE